MSWLWPLVVLVLGAGALAIAWRWLNRITLKADETVRTLDRVINGHDSLVANNAAEHQEHVAKLDALKAELVWLEDKLRHVDARLPVAPGARRSG